MNRREFVSLIASSIAWPTVAQARKTTPVIDQATTNPRGKDTRGKAKAKTVHHRRGTSKRLQNDGGKSNDYVYGKVHYRLKPAK